MMRKDITPKKSPGFFRRFGTSLLGGVLGAVLTIGIFYVANGSLLAPNNQNASGSPSAGNTKVSNMKVDVNSDITDAASKVQDAVVSVINLQKQQSQSGLGGFSDFSAEMTINSHRKIADSLKKHQRVLGSFTSWRAKQPTS